MAENPLFDLDIEALDEAAEGQSLSIVGGQGPSPNKRNGAQATPTPNKRRRRSSLLTGVVAAQMKEELEDELAAGALGELEENSYEADDQVDKHCHGCGRSCLSGVSWTNPGEPLHWGLPNRRGLWCRDCFTVWRLRFAPRFKLITMPTYFHNKSPVLTEFELGLVSFISLRREGSERITEQRLNDRMEMITWVLQAFGLPLHAFMVVPISEVTNVSSPSQLVTVKVNGSLQVGAMMPQAAIGSAIGIPRPVNEYCVALKSRGVLLSNEASDSTRVADLCGAQSSAIAVLTHRIDSEPAMSDMTKSEKKASNMVKTSIAAAALLLHSFASADWEDLKEASFSKPMQSLIDAKMEAAHEQLEVYIKEAEAWHTAFGALKLFVKRYREAGTGVQQQPGISIQMAGAGKCANEQTFDLVGPNMHGLGVHSNVSLPGRVRGIPCAMAQTGNSNT